MPATCRAEGDKVNAVVVKAPPGTVEQGRVSGNAPTRFFIWRFCDQSDPLKSLPPASASAYAPNSPSDIADAVMKFCTRHRIEVRLWRFRHQPSTAAGATPAAARLSPFPRPISNWRLARCFDKRTAELGKRRLILRYLFISQRSLPICGLAVLLPIFFIPPAQCTAFFRMAPPPGRHGEIVLLGCSQPFFTLVRLSR